MKIRTEQLTGHLLNWAVAQCEAEEYRHDTVWDGIGIEHRPHRYGEDWSQAGPLIERSRISVVPDTHSGKWVASLSDPKRVAYTNDHTPIGELPPRRLCTMTGPSARSAAMRCFVASHFGDQVEIPDAIWVRLRAAK